MFYEQPRIKRYFLHIIVSIKDSLQQQIHFNGNFFENKCCRCNEGLLYRLTCCLGCGVRKVEFFSIFHYLSFTDSNKQSLEFSVSCFALYFLRKPFLIVMEKDSFPASQTTFTLNEGSCSNSEQFFPFREIIFT